MERDDGAGADGSGALDQLQINSEHRLRSENLPFDIDVWYPVMAPFTFRTQFVPLTRTEATAIVHYQQRRFLERHTLDEADVRVLRALEERIDRAIRLHFTDRGKSAFLRLCGRSPKDAEPSPAKREQVRQTYEAELKRLLDAGEELCPNTKLRAIGRVPSWLCVSSGADAMSLLLTSERVFADMVDWTKWGEPEQVVLREWEPELRLEYEFRAFVCQNKVTAISQYDHYCVYPDLPPLKDKLQAMILAKWEELHPFVGMKSYVADFGYLPRRDCMVLIELSPFLDCTGTALFKWNTDRDQLEGGPLAFRLREDHYPHLEELIEVNWEDRWRKHVPEYSRWYDLGGTEAQAPTGNGLLKALYSSAIKFLAAPLDAPRAPGTLQQEEPLHLLFFYGTLKRDFHWNTKYLSRSRFVATARSVEPWPLVIGACGVPYLLGDMPGQQGKQIKGELWLVDEMTRRGLDEYEGVHKGYYCRRSIAVEIVDVAESSPWLRLPSGRASVYAGTYFKIESSAALGASEFIEEYPLDWHRTHYKPIRHIWVKQELYMKPHDPSSHQNT